MKTKEKEAELRNQLIQVKLHIERKSLDELIQRKESLLNEKRGTMSEGQNSNLHEKDRISVLMMDKYKKEIQLKGLVDEYAKMEDHTELKSKLGQTRGNINMFHKCLLLLIDFVKEVESRTDVYDFKKEDDSELRENIHPQLMELEPMLESTMPRHR